MGHGCPAWAHCGRIVSKNVLNSRMASSDTRSTGRNATNGKSCEIKLFDRLRGTGDHANTSSKHAGWGTRYVAARARERKLSSHHANLYGTDGETGRKARQMQSHAATANAVQKAAVSIQYSIHLAASTRRF